MAEWGAWIFRIAVLGFFAWIFLILLCMGVRKLICLWTTLSLMKKLHNIAALLVLFSMLNLALGMGIVEIGFLGGRATTGKVEHGKYYLGGGGEYTKVSENTYVLCLYYEKALLAITFSSLIAAAVTYVAQRMPRHTIFKMLGDDTYTKRGPFT